MPTFPGCIWLTCEEGAGSDPTLLCGIGIPHPFLLRGDGRWEGCFSTAGHVRTCGPCSFSLPWPDWDSRSAFAWRYHFRVLFAVSRALAHSCVGVPPVLSVCLFRPYPVRSLFARRGSRLSVFTSMKDKNLGWRNFPYHIHCKYFLSGVTLFF